MDHAYPPTIRMGRNERCGTHAQRLFQGHSLGIRGSENQVRAAVNRQASEGLNVLL